MITLQGQEIGKNLNWNKTKKQGSYVYSNRSKNPFFLHVLYKLNLLMNWSRIWFPHVLILLSKVWTVKKRSSLNTYISNPWNVCSSYHLNLDDNRSCSSPASRGQPSDILSPRYCTNDSRFYCKRVHLLFERYCVRLLPQISFYLNSYGTFTIHTTVRTYLECFCNQRDGCV